MIKHPTHLFLYFIFFVLLIVQLFLLALCLTLSELPLQTAAGLMTLGAFIAYSFLFSSPLINELTPTESERLTRRPHSIKQSPWKNNKTEKYFYPLIETMFSAIIINALSMRFNTNDVIEPFSSALWYTGLFVSICCLLCAGEMIRIRRLIRLQVQANTQAASDKELQDSGDRQEEHSVLRRSFNRVFR
jgi:hypothetical protein